MSMGENFHIFKAKSSKKIHEVCISRNDSSLSPSVMINCWDFVWSSTCVELVLTYVRQEGGRYRYLLGTSRCVELVLTYVRQEGGRHRYLLRYSCLLFECVKIRYFGMEGIKREDIATYLMTPSCSPDYETCLKLIIYGSFHLYCEIRNSVPCACLPCNTIKLSNKGKYIVIHNGRMVFPISEGIVCS